MKANGIFAPHDVFYKHHTLVGKKLTPSSAKTYMKALTELKDGLLAKDFR